MEPDVISLRDYVVVLRRRRGTIALTALVTVAAAMLVTFLQTPLYEGTAELAIEPIRRAEDASLEELILGDTTIETQRLVVTSQPVIERVVERLGAAGPDELVEQVRVEVVQDTRVVRIVAADPDPARAAAIANAFAESYLDYRRDQAVGELLDAQDNLTGRASDLREQIAQLDGELESAGEDDPDGDSLAAQRQSLLAELAQVVAEAAALDANSDVVRGGGDILSPAEVPIAPSSPKPLRTGVLALVLGLMLGVGLAFLRDHFDDAIRDDEGLKRALVGRPVLGRVPHWEEAAGGRFVTMVAPRSVASEAYRTLSANVRFLLAPQELDGQDEAHAGKSVLITSPGSGDGKTCTAANLAVAAARVGQRVILVDADLRRPAIAQRFGLGDVPGLSDALLTDKSLSEYVVDVGLPTLRVMPAGTVPPNPADLLASRAMRQVQRYLARHADLVVWDTPPALAVADTLELAPYVDLILLVARSGQSGRRAVAAAVERLEAVGGHVGGGVFNDLDARSDAYGYYSYSTYRSPDDAARPEGKRPTAARVPGDGAVTNGSRSLLGSLGVGRRAKSGSPQVIGDGSAKTRPARARGKGAEQPPVDESLFR